MTTPEWILVAVAGTLAAGVVGALLTLPVWTSGRRLRPVTALLGLHAGVRSVGGGILAAAAVQGWRQVGDPPEQAASSALLEISHVDGDESLYALLLLFIVAAAAAGAALLTVAARCAAADDAGSRAVACAVLGVEVGLCGYALARVLGGSGSAAFVIGVAHLPVLIGAMVISWPTYQRVHPARPERAARSPRHARS